MQETPVYFLGQGDSPQERISYPLQYSWASLVAQNLSAVHSIPGLGKSPRGGTATHSSTLAWRIPWTEEPVTKCRTHLSD